jgi:hypothetical protein
MVYLPPPPFELIPSSIADHVDVHRYVAAPCSAISLSVVVCWMPLYEGENLDLWRDRFSFLFALHIPQQKHSPRNIGQSSSSMTCGGLPNWLAEEDVKKNRLLHVLSD